MQDLSIVPEDFQSPVWMNGVMTPWNEAQFHLFSHNVNYGSSVFEGIRVYETPKGTAIFHLDAHLDRLDRSVASFGLTLPYSRDELVAAHKEVVRASGKAFGYLRPQVGFGLGKRVAITETDHTETSIFFQPLGQYRATNTLNVGLSDVERISPKAGDVEAKVVGFYTNSHYNHLWAHNNNVDDAIMLDVNGNVAESSAANVFYVKDGALYTPKTGYILKGITRATVIELAQKELGLSVNETIVTPDDLRNADEIFMTGTASEIVAVVTFDGTTVGNGATGAITQKLIDLYRQATMGELPGRESWLTYVDEEHAA